MVAAGQTERDPAGPRERPGLHRERYTSIGMVNVFFALTEEFNSDGVIALLASGQAVVFYRIALMSKDGIGC